MFNSFIHDFPTTPVATPPAPGPTAPKPPVERKDAEFSYNPQDEAVMSPGTVVLGKVGGPGPSVPKARLEGRNLEPVDGKFVFDKSDERYTAAVSLAAVGRTIEIFEKALGEPIKWAFRGEQLGIDPDAGEMLNAYYSRDEAGLRFFHHEDKVAGKTIYSGHSGEVAAHEAGHAILDGLRPGYFSTWSTEPAAFHESFGDVLSILVSLQDDRVAAQVAEQTGGDLSRPNMVADLGEEMGAAINHEMGKEGGNYVRTARNSFTYQNPDTLPPGNGPDNPGRGAHGFSRVWTGAFYDVLNGITQRNLAAGMAPAEALRATSDEGLEIYGNLFKTAPRGDFTFREMAAAIIRADERHNGGKNAGLMREVFEKRKILERGEEAGIPVSFKTSVRGAVEETTRPVRVTLRGPQYGLFEGAVVETRVDADGSLSKDAEAGNRLRKDLERLIADGRVKYTDPGTRLTSSDYFDAQGRPYVGVVRWDNGQMSLERVKIAT